MTFALTHGITSIVCRRLLICSGKAKLSFARTATAWPLPVGVLLASATLVGCLLNRPAGLPSSYWMTVKAMVDGQSGWAFPTVPTVDGRLIDKPPVYFWLAAAAVRFLGAHLWSVRLPDALAGVLSVGLVLILLRPYGRRPMLVGSSILALTPAWLLAASTTPMEPILLCFMLTVTLCITQWRRHGHPSWLLGAAMAMAVAFNTKEWAAVLAVPSWVLLVSTSGRFREQRTWLLCAVGLAAVLSFAWAIAAAVSPVGTAVSYSEGSIWSSIFGYNGLGRLSFSPGPFSPGNPFAPPVEPKPMLAPGSGWWLSGTAPLIWLASLPLIPLGLAIAIRQATDWTEGQTFLLACALWFVSVIAAYALVAVPLPQYLDEAIPPLALCAGLAFRQTANDCSACPLWIRLGRLGPTVSIGASRLLRRVGMAIGVTSVLGWSTFCWWGTQHMWVALAPAFVGATMLIRRKGLLAVATAAALCSAGLEDAAILQFWGRSEPWPALEQAVQKDARGLVLTSDLWTAADLSLNARVAARSVLDNYGRRAVLGVSDVAQLVEAGDVNVFVSAPQLELAAPDTFAWVLAHATTVEQFGPYELIRFG